ncbi:MAG: universal stress protein [Chloroflexota bacterium]|nr:universal stress protein [Chloroflexota bacterium]
MDGAGLSRILIALDGSPQSAEACRLAAELARCYGAALLALHVATPVAPGGSVSPAEYLRAEDAARAQGNRVLEEARILVRGLVSFAAELEFGNPAEVICRRARELDVDLVVVGTRGLGTLDRLLLRSVSSAVVQQAHCSVLVVRPRKADRPSPSDSGP